MGRRDRERRERIRARREAPHAVRIAEGPLRVMEAGGSFMEEGLQALRAASREECIQLAFDYVRAKGRFPKIEGDDGDTITIGMYCRHGESSAVLTIAEDEDSGGWFCSGQSFTSWGVY
jgi:hypothetical protein